MTRWLTALFTVYLLALGQAQAQNHSLPGQKEAVAPSVAGKPETKEPELIVDEREINISGWHGAGGGYSGSVRLTAKTQGGMKFVFLSSDLTRKKDGMKVDRQNVALDGDIQLSLDTPKNIKIKVTGIEEPGTYEGKVEFRPQGAASGKILDLRVIANATQPLTPLPGTEQIKLHLTTGKWSNFLLPRAETINTRELQFKNPFQIPVQLLAAEFILNGDQTGYQLKPPTVQVQNTNKEKPPDGSVVNLSLELNRSDIPPDKYTGSIFLRFAGTKEAVQLPVVELTMRYGPLRALGLLGVGILIGWFMLYMKTEGLALGRITRVLDELKADITLIERLDRLILQPMLRNVEFLIRNKKLEDAEKEMKNIEGRLTLLMNVEEIEKALQNPDPLLLEKIKAIRIAVKTGKNEEAQRLFDEINMMSVFEKQPSAKMAHAIIKEQIPDAKATPSAPEPFMLKKQWQTFHLFLIKWVGPPVYYVITLLILLFVGFTTLYLKNMTFGASPLGDYLGLILWGLGADVASRNVDKFLTPAK
jgi:hypothetical protein